MLGKILVCIFVLVCSCFAEDGIFCKISKDNWEICRHCNDSGLDCHDLSHENECKCDGIKIAKKDTYELHGGKENCQKDGEGWCFVRFSSESACTDLEWVSDNERFTTDPNLIGTPNIWLTPGTEFAKSKEACKSEMQHDTGNEEMLQDTRIITDFLRIGTIDDNGIQELKENFTFIAESHEECKQECQTREQCGAWSYDSEEFLCYLHTVDACCGQFDKRESASGFVSGYICKSCWSTRGDCPCSAKDRLEGTGTAHSSGGAVAPHLTTSAGVSCIQETESGGVDVCATIPKKFRPEGPFRYIKPVCKDPTKNPCGKCEDETRCRKSCPPKGCGCDLETVTESESTDSPPIVFDV